MKDSEREASGEVRCVSHCIHDVRFMRDGECKYYPWFTHPPESYICGHRCEYPTEPPTESVAPPSRIWINIPKGETVEGVDEPWWYENPMAFPTAEYAHLAPIKEKLARCYHDTATQQSLLLRIESSQYVILRKSDWESLKNAIEGEKVVNFKECDSCKSSPGAPVMCAGCSSNRQYIAVLEGSIRKHRDQRGDDRCWMDDEELYKVLPEGYTPPKRDTFVELELCKKFIESRQHPDTVYISPEREIETLRSTLSKIFEMCEHAGNNEHARYCAELAKRVIEK